MKFYLFRDAFENLKHFIKNYFKNKEILSHILTFLAKKLEIRRHSADRYLRESYTCHYRTEETS